MNRQHYRIQSRGRLTLFITKHLCTLAVIGVCHPVLGGGEPSSKLADSEVLSERWFPEPVVELHAPGAKDREWPGIEEVYAGMRELADESQRMNLLELGETLTGMPIRGLSYSSLRPDAMTVLLQARVHGDEPASTEGLMELAYHLAKGDLSETDLNVVIIPVLNPEGASAMRRETHTDIDPNRDYVLQNGGVVTAVYDIAKELDPEVIVDFHEFWAWKALGKPGDPGAYTSACDLKAIGANNPNIPQPLRTLIEESFIAGIDKSITEKALRFGPYRLVDVDDHGLRVRESATTFVSEKNAMAMGGKISLLVEGRGIGLGNQHYVRRTYAQYLAARSIIETASANEFVIKGVVANAKRQNGQRSDTWILRTQPVKISTEHKLLNPRKNEIEAVRATYWDRTNGKASLEVVVPAAYVIPVDQHGIIERLERFGVELIPVPADTPMTVETMTVSRFVAGESVLYGGAQTATDGSLIRPAIKRNHDIQVHTEIVKRIVPAGSQIAITRQEASPYLISLEPGSFSSFAAQSYWGDDLPVGFEFPIYRLPDAPPKRD